MLTLKTCDNSACAEKFWTRRDRLGGVRCRTAEVRELSVPGVRVLGHEWLLLRKPPGGLSGVKITVICGDLLFGRHLIGPPRIEQIQVHPDDAGNLMQKPLACWMPLAGREDLGVTEARLAVAGFIEHDASTAWLAVSEALADQWWDVVARPLWGPSR